MRKKNSQLRLQPIGEIIFPALKRRGLAVNIEGNSLMKLWPQAVGPQIARQTETDVLRGGTLFVKTTSPVWVQQLHFMKDDIRGKINNLAGKEAVKDIRFSVGPVAGRTGRKTEIQNSASAKLLLKDRDKKMIEKCTAELADRELAVIVKRVMQTEISRRRQRQLGR
jgi:predicted nucleic acid-binding Zn ribbon protein